MRMQNILCVQCLLLGAISLVIFSQPGALAARAGKDGGHSKGFSDPNVRDWGDYSDLEGLGQGLGLEEDHGQGGEQGPDDLTSSLTPEQDFLAEFAGKKRLWVITAPSHSDNYLRMMEKQLEYMEQGGLNCRLAERDTYIVTIIQNAMMEGRIQKTTFQGDAMVESLDPDTVTKLLHYLQLTNQDQFSMLVLKKNLRVSERFPYPVRVEAVLEIIDQFPMRKLEKMTRKGLGLRCKITKKKLVVKKKKKTVPSFQRQGAPTSLRVDKKAVIKSKIQDILNGRSRFVIRKTPVGSTAGVKESSAISATTTNAQEKHKTLKAAEGTASRGTGKDNRHDFVVEGAKKKDEAGKKKGKAEEKMDESQDKSGSKRKGNGKKRKKGKGRGKKSSADMSETEKKALKDFVESLKGTRRLMVISTPSGDATLYKQQKAENEKKHCELALRKITLATILATGRDATLTVHHFQLDSEPPFSGPPEQISDPDLISVLRAELGLSSPDLFSMTITDYDVKRNRVFEAPPSPSALLEYVDNFPSRRTEKEREKKASVSCSPNQQPSGAENTLLRFMSKRRLLIISAPTEDDYSFQQQISALNGQNCPMGIRHFALLKLIGTGPTASGSVELFPLNGRSQSEVEPLTHDVVNNLRAQLKISKDYFSMLVVGKDSDIKAWFPSPMWSLDNIYDLVDSMELRHQEEKLQRSLGIHCPEDRGGGGGGGDGGGYHGYGKEEEEEGESYLYHRTEE